MGRSLPKNYTVKIVKAIAEFQLLEDGDNLLVGLSGGKDSSFLLYALAVLKKHLAVDFSLSALTVDLGFGKQDLSGLEEYCQRLGVPFYIEKTRIAEYITGNPQGSPCARCAYLRKGAMAEFMKGRGFNKIAFGHHYDDAVVTYLMSIIYSGQLTTLQPKRYLSRTGFHIIRPLIYLREKRIIEGRDITGYTPIESSCPFDKHTTRTEVEREFRELIHDKQIFYNLVAAMRAGAPRELWPQEMPEEELKFEIARLWGKG